VSRDLKAQRGYQIWAPQSQGWVEVDDVLGVMGARQQNTEKSAARRGERL
jgi:hypothetical protein